MDEHTDVRAAFALRLLADLLTALVLLNTVSKTAVSALLGDSLNQALRDDPAHEAELREIVGAMTAQIGLAVVERDRQMNKD